MDKIWLKRYPTGVPETIDPDRFNSLVDIFEQSIQKYGDKVAFINMDTEMTFNELDVLSRHFAAFLQQRGLKKGDAFAIMMPNLLQYPVALFGALRAGLTVVNVNPLYTPRELKHQLKDAQVKAIVILENFAHTLAKVEDCVPVEQVFVTAIGDMLPAPKRWLVNAVVRHIKKMVPAYKLKNTT